CDRRPVIISDEEFTRNDCAAPETLEIPTGSHHDWVKWVDSRLSTEGVETSPDAMARPGLRGGCHRGAGDPQSDCVPDLPAPQGHPSSRSFGPCFSLQDGDPLRAQPGCLPPAPAPGGRPP